MATITPASVSISVSMPNQLIVTTTPYQWQLINLDGTSTNWANVPYAAVLQPTTALTAEIRCKLNAVLGSQPETQSYLLTDNGAGGGYLFYFHNVENKLYFSIYSAGWREVTWTVSGIDASKMHHYTGTFDGQWLRIYVDGVLKNSNDIGSIMAIIYSNSNFNIGAFGFETNNPTNYFINARLDDVRIWSTTRTQIDIQNYMLREVPANSTGLVGYWKLNESSGATITDSTANANDGTLNAGLRELLLYEPSPTTIQSSAKNVKTNQAIKPAKVDIVSSGPTSLEKNVSPKSYYGYKFNGTTSDYIQIPRSTSIEPTTLITVEYRLRFDVVIGSQINTCRIVHKWSDATMMGYESFVSGNNLVFRLNVDGNREIVYDASAWTTSEIHHVAQVYDGSDYILYIDGANVGSIGIASGTINHSASDLYLAVYENGGPILLPFQGMIDEVRIWNIARTQPQISTSKINEVDPGMSGLVGYWKLNEDSGTVAHESTNQSNHGTINGSTRNVIVYQPTANLNQYTAKTPTLIMGAVIVTPTAAVIQMSAQGVKANQLEIPNPAIGQFIVAASTLRLIQQATPSVVTLALPPPLLKLRVYINPTVTNFSAQSVKTNLIIYPNPTVANFNNNGITATYVLYPSPAVTNFSANIITATYVLYPTPASITYQAKNPTIELIQLPIPNIIPIVIGTSLEKNVAPKTYYGYSFNGTSDWIKVPYSANLQASLMTFEIRCKLTSLIQAQPQDYMTLGSITTGGTGWQFYIIKVTKLLHLHMYIDGIWREANVDISGINDDLEHNFAFSFDGRYGTIYVDGVSSGSFDMGSSGYVIDYGANSNLDIGAMGFATGNPEQWWIKAVLDEVRIWNYARSQVQISTNMLGEINPGTSGLVGYWKFNEDSGIIAHESTKLANNGVINGTIRNVLSYHPDPGIIQLTTNTITVSNVIYPSPSTAEFIAPSCKTSFSTVPNPAVITFTIPTPTIIHGIIYPTAVMANFTAQTPVIVLGTLTVLPTSAVINFAAQAIKANLIIYPDAATTTFSVNGVKTNLAIDPTAAIATFSAQTPTFVMGSVTVTPTATVANFSANAIASLQTIKPDSTSANFSVPTPTIDLSTRIYPTPTVINFTLPTPTLIEGTITVNVTAAQATFAAQTPTLTQIQNPTACTANFAAQAIKANLIIYPDAATVHFNVPTPHTSAIMYPTAATATFQANAITWTNIYTTHPTSTIASFSIPTPTLIEGSVTVTTAAATATFSAEAPKANLTIYPTAATATFTVPTPIIILISIVHATNAIVIFSVPTPKINYILITTPAIAQFIVPTPFVGQIFPDPVIVSFSANGIKTNLAINPTAAIANFSVPNPRITSTIIPSPASATFSAQTPVIIEGAIAVTPNSVTATFSANGIKASNIIYPTAAVINYVAKTPTIIHGAITVNPTVTSAAFSAKTPTIVLGTITVTTAPAVAAFSAKGVQLNLIIYPTASTIPIVAKNPSFVGHKVSPSASLVNFSAQTPTIVLGAITVIPSASSVAYSAKTPFVYSALITLNFTVKIFNVINYHVEIEER